MKKIIFLSILGLIYTGCVSSNVNTTEELKVKKTEKYAQNIGYTVTTTGYQSSRQITT